MADANGAIVSSTSYDSFGNAVPKQAAGSAASGAGNAAPNIATTYRYTGREYDEETGLYYYRNRWYDPEVGRFISEDPIGFAGGDINLYGYVGNNPLNFIDPFGYSACRPQKDQQDEDTCGVNPITNKPGINAVNSGKPGEIRPGKGGKGFFDSKRKRRGGKRGKHKALDISGRLKKPDTYILTPTEKGYTVKVVKGELASAVHASLGGTVSLARVRGGYGQRVVIDHGGGYQTAYAHLSETHVKKGDVVAQGKIIGRVGQTGNAKGQLASEAHVHFEVRLNGVAQRPGKFLNARCPKALRK